MLWEVEIQPAAGEIDREGARVLHEGQSFEIRSLREVRTGHSFLIQGPADQAEIERAAVSLLVDPLVERFQIRQLTKETSAKANGEIV